MKTTSELAAQIVANMPLASAETIVKAALDAQAAQYREDTQELRGLVADLYATTKTLIGAGHCDKAKDDAWAHYTHDICQQIETEFMPEFLARVGGKEVVNTSLEKAQYAEALKVATDALTQIQGQDGYWGETAEKALARIAELTPKP